MSTVLCLICKQYVPEQFSSPTCCEGRVCHRCEKRIERNAKPVSREAFALFNASWDKIEAQTQGNVK